MNYISRRLRSLVITAIILWVNPNTHAAEPGAFGLASIIPGLGHALNGQVLEGLGWFIGTAALATSKSSTLVNVGFDVWQYNMYDAYRDAGGRPTDNKNIIQNWSGNINPLNIIDPIGAPIVGASLISGAPNGYPALTSPKSLLIYSFVGLGEESLFRGFLYPSLSNAFDSRFMGATTSSALFSLAHVTGGGANLHPAVLGMRFLLGMFFCWQLTRNKYDLSQNIFAHSWYDIFLDEGDKLSKTHIGVRWNAFF